MKGGQRLRYTQRENEIRDSAAAPRPPRPLGSGWAKQMPWAKQMCRISNKQQQDQRLSVFNTTCLLQSFGRWTLDFVLKEGVCVYYYRDSTY
jgi:hypothetical protein